MKRYHINCDTYVNGRELSLKIVRKYEHLKNNWQEIKKLLMISRPAAPFGLLRNIYKENGKIQWTGTQPSKEWIRCGTALLRVLT
jgi:hypothetical protein